MLKNAVRTPQDSRQGRSRKLLFVTALCLLSCLYGIVAARCGVFPYTTVRDAVLAARALVEVYSEGKTVQIDEELSGPTVRNYAGVDDGALLLMTGGINRLPHESSTGHALAWIMDRSGDTKHVWEFDPSIWSNLKHVQEAPLKSEIEVIGLHLYEDGGLLVSFHGYGTWPYAVGLARYDKDSRLLWKKELFNHHWFTVADDGRIYVAAMQIVDSPKRIGDTAAQIVSDDNKLCVDVMMILDPQGNVLDEIPLLDTLVEAGWLGVFQGSTHRNIHASTPDPLHLNDVRLVTAEIAQRHAEIDEGDVLLSFRGLNMLAVLDPTTRVFKWMLTGATVRQHSPRFFEDGLLVFDNWGGSITTGGSRLVFIDFETQAHRTVFPHPSVPLPDNNFFTPLAGHIDPLPPNRVLVTLTVPSEVWEVDIETGEVLWRYTYVDPNTRQRLPIFTTKYVHDVGFPMNRVEETTQ
jgi:hypothetical protein